MHLGGMYTGLEEAESIVRLFVEGCSVRSIERVTGIHRDTILRVLVIVGSRCERFLEDRCRAIPVKDVQCDQMWSFVGCKEKRNIGGNPKRGDAYRFVAIERNTKLILAWDLGRRTERDTVAFTERLNEATAGEFQITTDGFPAYFDAIHMSLGTRVHYAQLVKIYERQQMTNTAIHQPEC